MTSRCPFSGRPADHGHHWTGRGVDGAYFDPALVLPLTLRQHIVEHQAWRRSGLDEASQLPRSVLRLRRAGHLLVRLGEQHGEGLVMLPAPSVRALGEMLNGVAEGIEEAP